MVTVEGDSVCVEYLYLFVLKLLDSFVPQWLHPLLGLLEDKEKKTD